MEQTEKQKRLQQQVKRKQKKASGGAARKKNPASTQSEATADLQSSLASKPKPAGPGETNISLVAVAAAGEQVREEQNRDTFHEEDTWTTVLSAKDKRLATLRREQEQHCTHATTAAATTSARATECVPAFTPTAPEFVPAAQRIFCQPDAVTTSPTAAAPAGTVALTSQGVSATTRPAGFPPTVPPSVGHDGVTTAASQAASDSAPATTASGTSALKMEALWQSTGGGNQPSTQLANGSSSHEAPHHHRSSPSQEMPPLMRRPNYPLVPAGTIQCTSTLHFDRT